MKRDPFLGKKVREFDFKFDSDVHQEFFRSMRLLPCISQ